MERPPKNRDPSRRSGGKVYLVGAGPGDPKLLTLRGFECLQEADVVLYDYLANERLLAYAPEGAERIYAGKRRGKPPGLPQEEINRLMIERARAGKVVVRLKGGDPFIFGRGGEEAEALANAGIPCDFIPGVTSATAVAAYAGIPLTHRSYSSSIALVTGHEDPTKETTTVPWKALKGFETVVFFMGMTTLSDVVKRLRAEGWSAATRIALIRWGTLPEQRTVTGTLDDIVERARKGEMRPPVMIVMGEVVGLRERLNWFETRPLFGKRIVVTRAREQASELSELLARHGAEPVEFPTIQVVPPDDWGEMDRAISGIDAFHWLLFTSANGVRSFMDRLRAGKKDIRALKGVRICAIGPRTAEEIERHGIMPDLVPPEYVAEAVLKALEREGVKGKKVLLPRAMAAREVLPEGLSKMGARVTVVTAYRTVKPEGHIEEIRKLLMAKEISAVTFTSSSTVKNFVEMFRGEDIKALMNGVVTASIGPITARTAEGFGMRTDIMPKKYTVPSLAEAIVSYFTRGE